MKTRVILSVFLLFAGFTCSAQDDTEWKATEKIELRNGTIHNGFITKQDLKKRRITFTSDGMERHFPIDSVRFIHRNTRPLDSAIGLLDIIETSKGTYEGQVTRHELAKGMMILTKDNKELFIKKEDIKSYKKKPLKTDVQKPLYEQSPFIETIKLKDGKTYTGVITLQTYSEPFIAVITDKNGENETIKRDDIEFISKERNMDFRNITATPIPDKIVKINGTEVVATQVNLNEKRSLVELILDPNDVIETTPINTDEVVTIEMLDTPSHRQTFLVKLQGTKEKMCFGIKEVINFIEPTKSTVDYGGNICREYKLGKGQYALYCKVDKKCYWFEINTKR